MASQIGPRHWTERNQFSIQYASIDEYAEMPKPHVHPYYEIFYLVSGERMFFIRDHVMTAKQGEMVIVRPNELHRTSSPTSCLYERFIIHYVPEFLVPVMGVEGRRFVSEGDPDPAWLLISFTPEERLAVENVLREMMRESETRKDGYDTCLRLLLMQLFIYIRRAGHQRPVREETHPLHRKVSEIAAYLNDHYHEPISLKQVADRFYISEAHLSRVFSKVTGYHFQEYIRFVRVREAQKMLRETKEKVLSIAMLTGFGHIAHFNKTFKAITGLSPLKYRKLYRTAK